MVRRRQTFQIIVKHFEIPVNCSFSSIEKQFNVSNLLKRLGGEIKKPAHFEPAFPSKRLVYLTTTMRFVTVLTPSVTVRV